MKKNYLNSGKRMLLACGFLCLAMGASAQYELKLEAENSQEQVGVKVKDCTTKIDAQGNPIASTASGGLIIEDMGSGEYIAWTINDVPADGTYDFTIAYYGTDTNRKCYIKVNKQVKSIVQFTEKSEDINWDGTSGACGFLTTQIYLKKGTNRIELGGYSGYGPNIDYATIETSDATIVEPEDETYCFKWDYTDESVVTAAGYANSEVMKAIDNNEKTSFVANADQVEFIINTPDPKIMATGFLVTPGPQNTIEPSNWKVSVSYDSGVTWKIIGTMILTKYENGSVYKAQVSPEDETKLGSNLFKLTATGDGVIDIAEFQLFGTPAPTTLDGFTNKTPAFLTDWTEGPVNKKASITSFTGTYLSWTSSVGGWSDSECVSYLFDDTWATKFCQTGSKTLTLEFDATENVFEPYNIASYTFCTGYSNLDRTPKDFKLYAREWSDAGPGAWEEISSVTGFYSFSRYTNYRFYTNIPEGKQYWDYKFEVTAVNGASDIQLAEFQLLNAEQTPKNYVKEGTSTSINSPVKDNGAMIYGEKGAVYIKSTGVTDYTIYNMTGVMIKKGTISTSDYIIIPSGVYIVVVNSANGTQTGKVLVK